MSLVAWYPLTRNLKDSISNPEIPISGTLLNDGKIGKCYHFIEDTTNFFTIEKLKGVRKFSFSLWLNYNSVDYDWPDIISFEETNGTATSIMRLETAYSYDNSKSFILVADNRGDSIWDMLLSGNLPCRTSPVPEEWRHYTVTLDGSNVRIYENGKFINSVTQLENAHLTGNVSIAAYCNIKLNNIKIYDHALSQAEILEDYRSMVLHYSFENPYIEPTVNLYNGITATNNSAQVILGEDEVGTYFILPYGAQWNDGIRLNNIPIVAGEYYTLSVELRSEVNTRASFDNNTSCENYTGNDTCRESLVNINDGSLKADTWTRVGYTLKTYPDASNPYEHSIITSPVPTIEGTEKKIYYRNIQFEQKPYPSPYTSSERLAGTIKDISGQFNNGIIENHCPIWSTDSKEGDYSLQFDGTNYIEITDTNFTDMFNNNSYTISFWLKLHKSSTQQLIFRVGDLYGLANRLHIIVRNNGQLSLAYGEDDFNSSYNFTDNLDIWTHITFTCKGNTRNLYINGELYETNESTHLINHLGSTDVAYIGAGKSEQGPMASYLYGQLDDFRIYAIPLSSNDVKNIYQVKSKVDKLGKLHTNKLVETKPENRAIDLSKIILTNYYVQTTTSYKDRILTAEVTTASSREDSSGVYISPKYFEGAFIPGERYRYSFWIKLPRSGSWNIKYERFSNEGKEYEAGIWYHIVREDIASNWQYFAMVIYFYNGLLEVGDQIQIRDLEIYRLDKDELEYNPKAVDKYNFKTFELTERNEIYNDIGTTIIQKDGAEWLRVFHHNTKEGTVFYTDAEEALNIQTINKYSILDRLEEFRGIDNKFEFLLEYPEDLPGEYNRWKQIDNPAIVMEAVTNTPTKASGYEAIHIDWDSNGTSNQNNGFSGLLKSSGYTDSTFIDGSIGIGSWFYAIGCMKSWNGSIPGPKSSQPMMGSVNLYVRIDNLPDYKNKLFKLIKRKTYTNELLEI